jgi:hypothetical protein
MDNSTFIILAVVSLLLNLTIGVFVANAAQRKGRSWAAFFWLSVVAGWLIMAIVVAAIAPIANSSSNSVQTQNAALRPVGIAFAILGVLWIITYYVSNADLPLGAATKPLDLQNWNILIGLAFAVFGFVISSSSSRSKNRK